MKEVYKNKLKEDLKNLLDILDEDKVSVAKQNFTLGRISLIRELLLEEE